MPNETDTQPEDRLQVMCGTVLLDAVQEAAEEFANSPDAPWQSNHSSTWVDPEAAFIAGAAWQASLNNSPLDRGASMTYDIRDAMIEALIPPISAMKIDPTSVYSGSIFEALDRSHLAYGGDTPTADDVIRRACELAAETALSVISNHLASEPRTKAETALIEFADGKVKEMRDNGFLHASDRAIPREILQAFVEELK